MCVCVCVCVCVLACVCVRVCVRVSVRAYTVAGPICCLDVFLFLLLIRSSSLA